MSSEPDSRSDHFQEPPRRGEVFIRRATPGDIEPIMAMSRRIYAMPAQRWTRAELESHQRVFPEGQLVAVDAESGGVVGMAASLIVLWDDYDVADSWRDFTEGGYFTNHDPDGHTLYGAEVMVDPRMQGRGIGKKIYAARRELVRELGLHRIRAGARLRGYSRFADQFPPQEYVARVMAGDIGDPTLSFQLKQGFTVLAVVPDYLKDDPESMGYAAVIEWLNLEQVTESGLPIGEDVAVEPEGE
ncbi:MAG: GNAT family N-acetyltransferase [Phycisphaeraceae bacterium]